MEDVALAELIEQILGQLIDNKQDQHELLLKLDSLIMIGDEISDKLDSLIEFSAWIFIVLIFWIVGGLFYKVISGILNR